MAYKFTFLCHKQGRPRKSSPFLPILSHTADFVRLRWNVWKRKLMHEYGNAWSSLEHGKTLQHLLLDRVAKFTSLRPEQGQGFIESAEPPYPNSCWVPPLGIPRLKKANSRVPQTTLEPSLPCVHVQSSKFAASTNWVFMYNLTAQNDCSGSGILAWANTIFNCEVFSTTKATHPRFWLVLSRYQNPYRGMATVNWLAIARCSTCNWTFYGVLFVVKKSTDNGKPVHALLISDYSNESFIPVENVHQQVAIAVESAVSCLKVIGCVDCFPGKWGYIVVATFSPTMLRARGKTWQHFGYTITAALLPPLVCPRFAEYHSCTYEHFCSHESFMNLAPGCSQKSVDFHRSGIT